MTNFKKHFVYSFLKQYATWIPEFENLTYPLLAICLKINNRFSIRSCGKSMVSNLWYASAWPLTKNNIVHIHFTSIEKEEKCYQPAEHWEHRIRCIRQQCLFKHRLLLKFESRSFNIYNSPINNECWVF